MYQRFEDNFFSTNDKVSFNNDNNDNNNNNNNNNNNHINNTNNNSNNSVFFRETNKENS